MTNEKYRGRLAPSPTGRLHLGHAATFYTAFRRARLAGGTLVFRIEDLDPARCRDEFQESATDDLGWLGIDWDEGPDAGPHAPYRQSARTTLYRRALERLKEKNLAYPCFCSRKDVVAAAGAPQGPEDEFIYTGTCRPAKTPAGPNAIPEPHSQQTSTISLSPTTNNQYPTTANPQSAAGSRQPLPAWRFLVPDGRVIQFEDGRASRCEFVAGRDFGDFVVWRKEDLPAYQLAVVVDDAAMGITEVVRGEDLLLSTARQLLLYEALELPPPAFYHCPLVTDERGERLAKRHDPLSIGSLREFGHTPEQVRAQWQRQPTITPMVRPTGTSDASSSGRA